MVIGMQGSATELRSSDEKILATAKHFIGDGGTFRGTDRGDTRLGLDDLLAIHGQGYAAAIDAGVQTIMASYNSWNGGKVHGNEFLLTDVLKGQMGFDGFVVSDWDAVEEVRGCRLTSCAKAINAGVDMIMVPRKWQAMLDNTLGDVQQGKIPMARIDDAVRRILRVKLRAGMFEKASPAKRASRMKHLIGHPEHRAIAREAVRKSLVLLKNEGDILPLSADQHILVAGNGADNITKQSGGWTLTWQGRENANSDFPGATSIFEGIQQAAQAAGGRSILSVDGSFDHTPDIAIVVFGEDPYAEGEGDVPTLEYQADTKADLALIRKLKSSGVPVVSVFLSGRPLCVNNEIEASDAFVAAWLPGSEGAGVADVLLRDAEGQVAYEFAGRLPFAWPDRHLNPAGDDLPVLSSLFPTGFGLNYNESVSRAETGAD
jgi:beta-glucosidase